VERRSAKQPFNWNKTGRSGSVEPRKRKKEKEEKGKEKEEKGEEKGTLKIPLRKGAVVRDPEPTGAV
jgi:hypothetical protein